MEKKIPMRTCIACRETKPKKELARIVKNEDGVFFDRTGKMNGRGAYICDNPECLEKLKKQRLLNRVFKMQIDEETYEKIMEAFLGNKK